MGHDDPRRCNDSVAFVALVCSYSIRVHSMNLGVVRCGRG